ncbi:MAG: DUF5596 domain-containing protein [Caldilineaceae bacterium]|nr:DUF5596 domain-containing protein [Caldilineaceae bacterium]
MVLASHSERGIPTEISIDTLSDLELWIRHFRQANGIWGFGEHGWLQFHFRGKLFKLGRLQFEISRYYFDHPVYRHRRTEKIVVLAADGARFREDGQFDGANEIEEPNAWTATLQSSSRGVIGYPFHPTGRAEHLSVELVADEWEQILARRDPVLGVHIPATGAMDFDACGHSFARALPFFAKHFPDLQPRAFICTSWLLDHQLTDYLDEQSNIVRFLKEWYLLPLKGASDHETFQRVFGASSTASSTAELSTLPQENSLQRAIVGHALGGGRWREAGGLLIPDVHQRWGEQIYQSGWSVKMASEDWRGVTFQHGSIIAGGSRGQRPDEALRF